MRTHGTDSSKTPRVVALPTPSLSKEHIAHLETSGLTAETLELAGLRTERDNKAIKRALNLRVAHDFGSAIVIPYLDADGVERWQRVRPDKPRSFSSAGKTYSAKYESPKGSSSRIYLPPRTRAGRLSDDSKPLVFVEGEKKALYLDQLGFAVVGGPGVDGFHSREIRTEEGVKRFAPDFEAAASLRGRQCVILFDADAHTNPNVMGAIKRLAGMLEAAGAVPYWTTPPKDGVEKGIDDFGVVHGREAVEEVLRSARRVVDPTDPRDVNSPVSAVYGLASAPVDKALRWPSSYKHTATGLWVEGGEGKDDSRVMDRVVLPRRILLDIFSGEERVEVAFRRRGQWRTAIVDRTAVGVGRTIVEALRPLGANVDSTNAGDVVRWLSAFEETNEEALPRTVCTGRCGWHKTGDEWTVVAPRLVDHDDLLFDGSSGRSSIVRGLGVAKGAELETHRAALCAAWNASPIAAAAICASLAAPLLRVLGVPSFALSLFGDSSTGKTTMGKLAASVYGDPTAESWFPSWNGTTVSHEVRAHVLSDLPFFLDEVGSGDVKRQAETIYMLTNGTGRTRGSKDGGLRETHSWNTVVISTGEASLVPDDAPTGAAVRVLELFVDGFGELDAAGVDALRDAASENHGAVGKAWLEAIVGMDRETVVELRRRYREAIVDVRRDSPAGSLAARQAAQIALLGIVAWLSSEWLGIGDEASLHAFFRERQARPEGQIETAPTRALSLVRDWIASEPGAFPHLVLDSSGATVSKDAGSRVIHGYRRDGVAYLLRGPLRTELARHGMAELPVVRGWESAGLLEADRAGGRFSTKIRVNGDRVRVVAIRYSEACDGENEG